MRYFRGSNPLAIADLTNEYIAQVTSAPFTVLENNQFLCPITRLLIPRPSVDYAAFGIIDGKGHTPIVCAEKIVPMCRIIPRRKAFLGDVHACAERSPERARRAEIHRIRVREHQEGRVHGIAHALFRRDEEIQDEGTDRIRDQIRRKDASVSRPKIGPIVVQGCTASGRKRKIPVTPKGHFPG